MSACKVCGGDTRWAENLCFECELRWVESREMARCSLYAEAYVRTGSACDRAAALVALQDFIARSRSERLNGGKA